MVLFVMLYRVVLTFESVTIQMKVILWYFHILVFVLFFPKKEF